MAAWGANWNDQCVLPAVGDVLAVSAGEDHSVALLATSLPAPRLLSPVRKGARFSMLAQTLNRRNYALQYKASVAPTNWATLSTNRGNGVVRVLNDPAASGPQRFYRLSQW